MGTVLNMNKQRDTHIIYLGSSIKAFLNPIDYDECINIFQKDDELLQNLPICQDGIMLTCTLIRLFEIYILHNMVKEVVFVPDTRMNYAFGGTIPASFYLYKDCGGNVHKIPMIYAVERGIITKELNTYEVLERIIVGFNRKKIHRSYIKYFIMAGTYGLNDMDLDNQDPLNKLMKFDPTSYEILPDMIIFLLKPGMQCDLEYEYQMTIHTLYQMYHVMAQHDKIIYKVNQLAEQGDIQSLIKFGEQGIFPNIHGIERALKQGQYLTVQWIQDHKYILY